MGRRGAERKIGGSKKELGGETAVVGSIPALSRTPRLNDAGELGRCRLKKGGTTGEHQRAGSLMISSGGAIMQGR